jgi:hypothetical protein
MKPVESIWIEFKLVEKKAKTNVWQVLNKNDKALLATIKWYPRWRQYCIFSEPNIVFSLGCWDDIEKFLKQVSLDYIKIREYQKFSGFRRYPVSRFEQKDIKQGDLLSRRDSGHKNKTR